MHHTAKILSTLLIILLCAFNGAGRNYYSFRQLGSDQGLSGSFVKAIAQDSRGFIWLGTKNGLDRYDGISLKSFTCQDDRAHHSNNNIGAVLEGPDGTIWVGTDRGVYRFDPRSEEFTYLDAQSRSGVQAEDWVQSIQSDKAGNIWMLVPNQGVFRFKDDNLHYYSVTNHNGDKEKLPTSMVVTPEGAVYVGSNRQGLYFYDDQTNMFRRMDGDAQSMGMLNDASLTVLTMMEDGALFGASQQGQIYRIDPVSRRADKVEFSRAGKAFIYSLATVGRDLWIGTTEGVWIKNSAGEETEISRHSMGDRSLTDNTVTVMHCDRDKNMWVGTMHGGVTYVQRTGLIFEKYVADNSARGLTGNHIRGMAVDDNGKIWVGTEGAGLNVLDPENGRVTRYPDERPEHQIALCVENIGGKIHVGFARGGCVIINDGHSVSTLGLDLTESASDVYSVLSDRDGNLWIGASWGLFRRNKGEEEFRPVEDIGFGWVCDMLQDRQGRLWVATMGDGIWQYVPSTGVYRHYAFDEEYTNGLRSNSVSSVFEDSKGRLWFTTDRGGLARYDADSDRFVSYGTMENLPDDTVYNILEDDLGYLWFGTNRGLVKFNPINGDVVLFSSGNNQFNYNSAVKGPDGRFYMGGINGLIAFNPEADDAPRAEVPVYFTNLKVSGSYDNGGRRVESMLYTDHIHLDPDQGTFSISIGSPSYVSKGDERFVYRMLPGSEEWTPVADPANLSFAALSPGNYILEVMRLGDDISNVRRLEVTVAAPWYRTWWAYMIYLMLVVTGMLVYWEYYRRSQHKLLKEKESLFTIAQEKELYKKKMQFFTEIAHEIRTPLTLIGTPLEAIEEIGVKDSRVQRYLKVIRQNTSRLLDLTGQILDFQKMDSERHTLKYETTDITALVQEIIDRFELTMSMRSKELIVRLPEKPVVADVDKDAVIKVLSNLLNNAMKYSEHKIEVDMSADGDNFMVSVKSDGEKITGENRLKIFEPFYQMSNKADNGGVGIGLPLCRTLAHLHGGTIELVDDDEPDSNTFRLTLPLRLAEEENNGIDASPVLTEYVMAEDSPASSDNSSYSLLFVDDNEEMREFLSEQLSQNFVVETACDGAEALEKLREQRFDIVVTDIMMPVMDGYQLCMAIKEDPNLSPIPVVFLTAKNDLTSKVRALECGGESYIEKPFSIKYFRQQIKSLLDNRRHERKAFLNKPFFTVDNMKLNKADEEFMNDVMKLINENIDNEDFNVETMAEKFCMSRSSLLRKIKTLFNLSPVELIRIVRLKKAAELIQEGKYRMGDICYKVGINSQSYFTRLFFKQFGITPKAFEKQCQENSQGNAPRAAADITEEMNLEDIMVQDQED